MITLARPVDQRLITLEPKRIEPAYRPRDIERASPLRRFLHRCRWGSRSRVVLGTLQVVMPNRRRS